MIDLSQFDGHTEGPWHYVENSWSDTTIYDKDKNCICSISIEGGATEDNEYELAKVALANARLISAVPELLAEVKRLRSQLAEAIESLDELTLVVGLTPVSGNLNVLQDAVNQSRDIINKHKPIRQYEH